MNNNPIGWFEIYVQDMPRAKKFYESVFKFNLVPLENPDPGTFSEMEMLSFPCNTEGYGAPGALVKMPNFSSGSGGTLVYFSCEDCKIEAERAASNGGEIVQPKVSIGAHGHIALVTDTEGNTIGLHSMQ